MNEYIDDAFLYTHIPRAEQKIIDSLPAEDTLDHTFSSRFHRKMNALMKYERRGSFGRFAVQFGWVAAAVLAIVILLNTVPEVNIPTVTELVPIEPSYIPEGFEMIEQFSDASSFTAIYLNEDGQEIHYIQSIVTYGEPYIDSEDATVEIVQINTSLLIIYCV